MEQDSLYRLEVINRLSPIDLSEMKSIKLMNRVDVKYVSVRDKLEPLLSLAEGDYRLQYVKSCPISSYRTLYYDTDDMEMYIRHHNRQLKRQKIRTRTYVESELSFIEVKNKSNKGRTIKVRREIPQSAFDDFAKNREAADFVTVEGRYPLESLAPSLQTSFLRLTLVNNEKTERITIDTGLTFSNLRTGITVRLPNLMIIELKRDGTMPSMMERYLSELRIKPEKISKYCIGVSMTNPVIKKNRFKRKVRLVNGITEVIIEGNNQKNI